jgi:ethanolamine utilization protein EutP (predicted NTPase)
VGIPGKVDIAEQADILGRADTQAHLVIVGNQAILELEPVDTVE